MFDQMIEGMIAIVGEIVSKIVYNSMKNASEHYI